MYVFGIEIPLVEIVIALGIIGIIILFEISVVLILITYHLKNSKRLEAEMGRLTHTLMRLQGKELKGLEELKKIKGTKKAIKSLETVKAKIKKLKK